MADRRSPTSSLRIAHQHLFFSIILDIPLSASVDVRRAQVGKLIKKIVVRPNVISRHLPVGENSEEDVRNVVDERAAVVREGRGAFGVIAQEVRQ
jgi:hypothetical protein